MNVSDVSTGLERIFTDKEARISVQTNIMKGDVESGSFAESGYETDITSQFKVDAFLNSVEQKVVIFAKSNCPYCYELKRSLGENFSIPCFC